MAALEHLDCGARARASLLVEPKLIHSCGRVAHLEDIAIDDDGALGELLGSALTRTRETGCYKIIASCSAHEVAAYEAQGFEDKGYQMRRALPTTPTQDAATWRSYHAPLSDAHPDITARPIAAGDFDLGALALLAQLTVVGDVQREQFVEHVERMDASSHTLTLVLESIPANQPPQLVGIGTVLLVQAGGGEAAHLRAHIEDIVVDQGMRGRGVGARLINCLVDAAQRACASSVILECSRSNAPFYAKLGFEQTHTSMARYL